MTLIEKSSVHRWTTNYELTTVASEVRIKSSKGITSNTVFKSNTISATTEHPANLRNPFGEAC